VRVVEVTIMSAFHLELGASFHEKVIAAGDQAFGAWVRAGIWSAARKTRGFIPRDVLPLFGGEETWKRLAAARAGHVHGLAEPLEGGDYQIHDFEAYNPLGAPALAPSAETPAAPPVEVVPAPITSRSPTSPTSDDIRAKRAAAGRAGAARRWQNRMANDGNTDGKTAFCHDFANGKNSKPLVASGSKNLSSLSSDLHEMNEERDGEEGSTLLGTAREADGKMANDAPADGKTGMAKPDGKNGKPPAPSLRSIRIPNEGRESDLDFIRRRAEEPGAHGHNYCRGVADFLDRSARVTLTTEQRRAVAEIRTENDAIEARRVEDEARAARLRAIALSAGERMRTGEYQALLAAEQAARDYIDPAEQARRDAARRAFLDSMLGPGGKLVPLQGAA
jgi:hypothetical protein